MANLLALVCALGVITVGVMGQSCTPGMSVVQGSFTWDQAQAACSQRGLKFASLENQAKIDRAYELVEPFRYIWSSGTKQGLSRTVTWQNGARSIPDWSFTGANRVKQPDNRENGNERCVAILNNFYGDGKKFHDIGCHHRKPALCEC